VVLHRPFDRVIRLWYILLFGPAFVVVGTIELIHRILLRLRGSDRDRPGRPAFKRPRGMPSGDARSVQDVVSELLRFPHRPLNLPPRLAFFRENGADGLGMLFSTKPAVPTLPHLYPSQFRPRLFSGADGVQLSALQAMHAKPGPALIICHGFLTDKNFDYIRTIARRAYRDWGFHVVTFDLRSFGQTAWTSQAPSTSGYKEGQDVVEVARELKANPLVTSVGVLGYSLGGCTALNAARESSDAPDSPIDGGVLTVSAPTEMRRAIEYVSKRPPFSHPYFGLWLIFQISFHAGLRNNGLDRSLREWGDIVKDQSLPYYNVDEETFYERASAARFADRIQIPVLALHARDDFLVPVDHAEVLADATAENPNVHVWMIDQGAHCSFNAIDRRWYTSVVRRWFEYWATDVRDREHQQSAATNGTVGSAG
jgi:predicted alpha/beta-fold hydrolase